METEVNELASIKKYVSASQTININDKNRIINYNDLLSIKHYLEASRTIDMNDKTRILNAINIFFLTNCEHEIITDYIDITPEKGRNIKYCSKCDITFDR